METQVTYLIPSTGVTVTLPAAAVRHGQDLSPEVAALFIDAALRAGAPIEGRMAEVQRLRDLNPEELEAARNAPPGSAVPAWTTDPQPDVWVEAWHGPEPFPVFLGVGSDVVAEFYPCIDKPEGSR